MAPLIHTHLHAVLATDLKPHLSGDDLCSDERYEGFLVCLLSGLQINSQAKVLRSMIQQYIEANTYVYTQGHCFLHTTVDWENFALKIISRSRPTRKI